MTIQDIIFGVTFFPHFFYKVKCPKQLFFFSLKSKLNTIFLYTVGVQNRRGGWVGWLVHICFSGLLIFFSKWHVVLLILQSGGGGSEAANRETSNPEN